MKKKKALRIIIIVAIILIVIVGVCILIRVKTSSKNVDVYSVSNISYYEYDYGSSISAMVSDGEVQKVLLREGLVDSIDVKVGDQVKKGDVLMKYDETSYKLILQKDEADIAVAENTLRMKQESLKKLQTLKPSEQAPKATEETIDHGALDIKAALTASDLTGGVLEFNCSTETTLASDFLKAVRTLGADIHLNIYDEETLYGVYTLKGALLPGEYYDYSESATTGGTGETLYSRTAVDPLDTDISLSGLFTVTEGKISVHTGNTENLKGSFDWCEPSPYVRYETVIHEPAVSENPEDYIYSSAELVSMVKALEKELKSLELDLEGKKINYQRDKLENIDGTITAKMDGEVIEVKSPAECSVGDSLITLKGKGSYSIVAYVSEMNLPNVRLGDTLTITTYMNGSNLTASVTEIGSTPTDSMYYGNNLSYYPVTAIVNDWDIAPEIGDWGEAKFVSEEASQEAAFCLPLMYVRDDDKGHYVYVMNENSKLEKRYVKTGKILWGWEITIKDGLLQEDYIAFPYGKSVKEGANAVVSEEWL